LIAGFFVACATNPVAAIKPPVTFNWHQALPNEFSTTYRSPLRWSEQSSREAFLYWNAVLAMRNGMRYFAIEQQAVQRAQRLSPGRFGMEPYYELKAVMKTFSEQPPANAIDAQEVLRRLHRPLDGLML